jgi:hypothetical protein
MPRIRRYIKEDLIGLLQKTNALRQVDKGWLTIWLLIYLSFILLDISYPIIHIDSAIIKYAGIFLCFIYAYTNFRKDSRLVIAMALTLLSDTILMFTGAKIVGVYVFCFAQFFHTLRLSSASKKFLPLYFFFVFLAFAFWLLQGIPAIYAISFVYATGLIINFYLARKWYHADRTSTRSTCALLGLSLFICCDICVGLSYLSGVGFVWPIIGVVTNVLVFIFYYPSQILLSNSSKIH